MKMARPPKTNAATQLMFKVHFLSQHLKPLHSKGAVHQTCWFKDLSLGMDICDPRFNAEEVK